MKKWLSLGFLAVSLALVGYFVGPTLLGQPKAGELAPVKEPTTYRHIVKRILPAVVSIEAQSTVAKVGIDGNTQQRELPFDDSKIPEEFRKFFKDFKRFEMPQMPQVPRRGFGSGFFVSEKGVILTNNHVVAGADSVRVTLQDGRKFVSRDIRGDRNTDLAIVVLNVKGEKFPFLELGDSDNIEIGDRVLAAGAPFGLRGSVTSGIISGKQRAMNLNLYEDFLQTDAAINPGNSGGPLAALDGRVIGINSAIRSRSGGFQGVGLAIPSNMAKSVKDALLKDGVVRRGYLGVQVRDLDPDVAKRLNVPVKTGVVVGQVFDKTPASDAGIQAGDIILKVGGKNVADGRTLQRLIARAPIDKSVDMTINRDGKEQTVGVTVREQPKNFGNQRAAAPRQPRSTPEAVTLDKLGVEFTDMTKKLADDFGYKNAADGVVITNVKTGSVADFGGLSKGMMIVKVDKQSVSNANEAREALNKASLADGVLLQVQSPRGGTNYVLLKSQS